MDTNILNLDTFLYMSSVVPYCYKCLRNIAIVDLALVVYYLVISHVSPVRPDEH